MNYVTIGQIAVALLTATTLAVPFAINAEAAVTHHPACQASQTRVTAGTVVLNATYYKKSGQGDGGC